MEPLKGEKTRTIRTSGLPPEKREELARKREQEQREEAAKQERERQEKKARRERELVERVKNLNIPLAVIELQDQFQRQKIDLDKVKWELEELPKLQKAQEEQTDLIKSIQNAQKQLLDAINEISETLDEYLREARPEGSQAAQTVAEKIKGIEEDLEAIWEWIEEFKKHLGLTD